MSYTALGVPLVQCDDDFDCDGADLCCQDYCRTGADIDVYCGELIEIPPNTITGKPTPLLTKPPSSPPPATITPTTAGVGVGTMVALVVAITAGVWMLGRN